MDYAVLIAAAITSCAYVVYPALGEAVSELSGVYEIGTEGIMLISAATSFMSALLSGSVMLGIVIGIITGALMGVLQGVFAINVRADQIVFGIGVIFLGPFLSSLIARTAIGGRTYADAIAPTLPTVKLDIAYPFNVILRQNVLFYVSIPLLFVVWFVFFHTRFGLKVRAVGESGYVSASNGINVVAMRYICSIIGGAIAAMGGVFVILGLTGIWADNLTGGRGFIAIAMVRVGLFRPFTIFLACLLFGVIDSIQLNLQATSSFPYQFLQMIPYFVGIVVLIISTLFRVFKEPSDIGKPYTKEQR